MSFILWTIWFIIIAVMVNIVMERLWSRIGVQVPEREREPLGRHRS